MVGKMAIRTTSVIPLLLVLALVACDGPPSFVIHQDGGPAVDLGPAPDLTAEDGAWPDLAPDLIRSAGTRPTAFEMLEILTSPLMTGRKSGTPGGTLAADYIAQRLAACGVKPFGDAPNSYRQSFKVSPIVHTGKMALSVQHPGAPVHSIQYRQEWRCGRTSPGADLSAPLVFVGYGLADPKHDDYKGISVKGKAVLTFRGCPPGSGIKGCDDLSKVTTAAQLQAAALVLVANQDASVDMWGGVQGHKLLAIPTAVIKPLPADKLLSPGKSLNDLRSTLDTSGPASFDTGATIKLLMSRTVFKDADAHNVLGIVPASEPRTVASYVVAGAHYDHLGYDEPPHSYYPGALDNASGTAVVIDAACRLVEEGGSRTRAVVVGLWAAEEEGLLGSRYFVDSGRVVPGAIHAAFNLDMVGGTGGGPMRVAMSPALQRPLRQLIEPQLSAMSMEVQLGPIVTVNSDHINFVAKGVPTFYFMGPHPEPLLYHTSTDRALQLSPAALDQQGWLLARTAAAAAR
jgi:hypothetical protein